MFLMAEFFAPLRLDNTSTIYYYIYVSLVLKMHEVGFGQYCLFHLRNSLRGILCSFFGQHKQQQLPSSGFGRGEVFRASK